MPLDPIDRIAGRIAQETLAGQHAQHPRARIAHFMLANAYRAMVRRLLKQEIAKPGDGEAPVADGLPYESAGPARTGFLADRSA